MMNYKSSFYFLSQVNEIDFMWLITEQLILIETRCVKADRCRWREYTSQNIIPSHPIPPAIHPSHINIYTHTFSIKVKSLDMLGFLTWTTLETPTLTEPITFQERTCNFCHCYLFTAGWNEAYVTSSVFCSRTHLDHAPAGIWT